MVAYHARALLPHRGKTLFRELELHRRATPVHLRIIRLERQHVVALAARLLQHEKRPRTRAVVRAALAYELALRRHALLAEPEELRLPAAAGVHHQRGPLQRAFADLLPAREGDDELGTFVQQAPLQVVAAALVAVHHDLHRVRRLRRRRRMNRNAARHRSKGYQGFLHFSCSFILGRRSRRRLLAQPGTDPYQFFLPPRLRDETQE